MLISPRHCALALASLTLLTACGDNQGGDTPTVSAAPTPSPTWPAAFSECGPWVPEVYSPAPAVDDPFWEGGIIYQVWVRSFFDGAQEDGIGDLQGITKKLDYIESLGTTILWLSPTFPSPSDHGYDVLDYTSTRDLYGGDDALDALIAAAKARGIEILLDVPINHTSLSHPWFMASVDPESAERGYYLWSDDDPGFDDWHRYGDDYYYGHFWSGMPDLNFESEAVRGALISAFEGWMERGVKAFRIDAARHLVEEGEVIAEHPGTYCALRGLRQSLAKSAPDVLLVGEVWSSVPVIASYLDDESDTGPGADLLPLAFDFPVAEQILSSIKRGSPVTFLDAHRQRDRLYPDPAMGVPFLSNHDQDRVGSVLGSDLPSLKLAAGLLFSTPGPVAIYYGEEIGMTGSKGPSDSTDNPRRTPMQWSDAAPGYGFTTASPWYAVNDDAPLINVAEQEDDPASLLNTYRKLAELRGEYSALKTGSITTLTATDPAIYAVARQRDDETFLIIGNLSGALVNEVSVDVTGLGGGVLGGGLEDVLGISPEIDVVEGEGEVIFRDVDARGVWYFALEGPSKNSL